MCYFEEYWWACLTRDYNSAANVGALAVVEEGGADVFFLWEEAMYVLRRFGVAENIGQKCIEKKVITENCKLFE